MTADDRTPDIREVRSMYGAGSNLFRETPEQHYLGHPAPDYGAEFDRFLARVRREAQAEAWEAWTSGLATHLDGATPRAWGFHHPCDPPGERWEPSVKDRTLMEVADFLRDREANPNPHHTTEKESRHDD